MNTMKTLVACLISTALFTSCNELKGTLSVSSPITVRTKDNKSHIIPPGSSKIEVKVKESNLLNLEVKTLSGEKDIKVRTNFNAKQLRDGQIIDIPSSITGQPFSVRGQYSDKTTRSETISSVESCTYTVTERQCREIVTPRLCQQVTECHPRRPHECRTREVCTGGRETVCEDILVTRHGSQDVSYYNTYRRVDLIVELVIDQQVPGKISASNSESNKIYTYQGHCW